MPLLVGIFVVFFVGGPLIFRALTRAAPSRSAVRALAVFAGVSALFGIGVRYGFSSLWGENTALTLVCLFAIWLAWIGILALGAQVLRAREPGLRMRRWTGVIGAVGTTVPWFGLASADLMTR